MNKVKLVLNYDEALPESRTVYRVQKYGDFVKKVLPESWKGLPILRKMLRRYEKIPKQVDSALIYKYLRILLRLSVAQASMACHLQL